MAASRPPALAALQEAGIITAEQYRLAAQHPLGHGVDRRTQLLDTLQWLLVNRIVDVDGLRDARRTMPELHPEEAAARWIALLDAAWPARAPFDALVAHGLISAEECEDALDALPPGRVYATPAEALLFMMHGGLIDKARIAAADTAAVGDAASERATILRDAARRYKKEGVKSRKDLRRALLLPALVLVGALAVGFNVVPSLMAQTADAPPCGDPEIRLSLWRMGAQAALQANPAPGAPLDAPAFGPSHEIGYARAHRVRGCVADIMIGGVAQEFAYTIAPSGKRGDFRISGAEPAIVHTRFMHLDRQKGGYANRAEPVGRAEVTQAFQAGAAQLPAQRKLTVTDLEPMAPCREAGGGAYSCRLLVAVTTPAGEGDALRRSAIAGDFTFQRDGTAGNWRVADGFAAELDKAVAAGPAQVDVPERPVPLRERVRALREEAAQ